MHISNIRRDTEGRALAATLTDSDNDTQLNIMNIYAPNIPLEHQISFDKLWQYKPGDTNILLAGDFNCVETPDLDKPGGNPASGRQGIVELNQFVDHNDLHDTWRKSHPNDRVYTWHNKDFTLRLDRWYMQSSAKTHTSIRACPFSNHSVTDEEKGFRKSTSKLLMTKASSGIYVPSTNSGRARTMQNGTMQNVITKRSPLHTRSGRVATETMIYAS